MNTIEKNRLVVTYAEMLYAYSKPEVFIWPDMSDDRKPWIDRAENELKGMGWI